MGCTNSTLVVGEPPPAANLPERKEQIVSYWVKNEGDLLEEPLQYIQLIKVEALIELGELQAKQRAEGQEITRMPRCQDWPAIAVADTSTLQAWSKTHGSDSTLHQVSGLPIIVLSICWLDPEHPDRFGEQLAMLLPIFRIYAAEGPFAVLWDYCSLPQRGPQGDDRSPEQLKCFKNALRNINRWYVHRLTTVVLVTKLPSDLSKYKTSRGYFDRGWTTTERALASIVKSTDCFLDTAKVALLRNPDALTVDDLPKLVGDRNAPLDPDSFTLMLTTAVHEQRIKFTASADLKLVCDQYELGFTARLSSTESLHYAGLAWTDTEVKRLCDAFTKCPALKLQRLRLKHNSLTDDSADLLAQTLAKDFLPQLKHLNLEGNRMSEPGTSLLRVVCKAKEVNLRVDDQNDEGTASVRKELTAPGDVAEAIAKLKRQSIASDDVFVVRSGQFAGSYDAVYISTDLEPDDVLAIKALAPRLQHVRLFCVVGEHALDKRQMMMDILVHSGLARRAHVVSGRKSRMDYPAGVEAAFSPEGSRVSDRLRTAGAEQPCAQQLEAFLQEAEHPLAILLKPMHELRDLAESTLRKTVAVAYGSFNFTQMQLEMVADASAAGQDLNVQDAFEQQMSLFSQFKRCTIVERACSIGRVESLNAQQPIWRHIEEDKKLMKLVSGWQQISLSEITSNGLPTLTDEMFAHVSQLSHEPKDKAEMAADGDRLTYAKLVQVAIRAEKKLGILKDICLHDAMQMPLADPLVVALLLDDEGELTPFLKLCRTTMDAAGKMSVIPDPSGTIHWLISEGEASRKDLVLRVSKILGDALE